MQELLISVICIVIPVARSPISEYASRDKVLEPESVFLTNPVGGGSSNILQLFGMCFYWQCIVYCWLQYCCQLSLAHLGAGCITARPILYSLSRVIYLEQFPLYQSTRLMPSFNMLFTHKNKLFTAARVCVCVQEGEGKMNGPRCPSPICYITV